MDDLKGMQLVRATRGASAKIARALGITRGAVAQWERIPAEHIIASEEASGIDRRLLRPDLYEPPSPLDTKDQAA